MALMTRQQKLAEISAVDHAEASTADDHEAGGQLLFGMTSDQFVNEAIGELGRRLENNESIQIDIGLDSITVPPEQSLAPVVKILEETISAALSRTHVRTSRAREINSALSELGATSQDERWVPPSTQPFPGTADDDLTIYPNDTVDTAAVADVGINPDNVPSVGDDQQGLYALNPTFVGNSSPQNFPKQVARFRRYFEAFAETVQERHDPGEASCMTCGRESMPAYKDVDDGDLEYNQTFTILASASGRAAALGYSSRDTAHRGRCAACLVAGFYYSLIQKLIRPTGTDENDVRVFSPVGNLEQLVRIRSDFASLPDRQSIDPPTAEEYSGRRTVGRLRTPAQGMQILEFYEQVLRHINTIVTGDGLFERELAYRPTGLTTYLSEVGRTRKIHSLESIDPDTWAYDAVRQRPFATGTDQTDYWPVTEVLGWYANLTLADDNKHTIVQNDLAFGILEQSLARIEQAVFETTKLLDRAEVESQYTPHPGYRDDYFQYIMTQSTASDRIDDEAIESIRRVASALGRVFQGQNDIGVLIKLQNASSPNTFLQAFEKAAMQAQKRSHDEPPGKFETSRDDDVSRVLQLVANQETFEPTKRMFVIHASLAAQYETVRQQESDPSAQTDNPETATGSE
jgi:hypothetical protein